MNKKILLFLIVSIFAGSTYSQELSMLSNVPALTVTQFADSENYSISIQILLLMTVLTLLPAVILTMTSFTRIIIVLGILRQAIGMPQTPSNQILIGISLFLTLFIMAPVMTEIHQKAVEPYLTDKISFPAALEKAKLPIHAFMASQTRISDLDVFTQIANQPSVEKVEEVPFLVLLPAFVTSELKTAFQIGFLLFIPFLIIDLVVASVLMAMGMMMLSPLIISLPFKIMLFVLVDGWTLVVGTLAGSFGGT